MLKIVTFGLLRPSRELSKLAQNLAGKRFGRLLVSDQWLHRKSRMSVTVHWRCDCDCGASTVVPAVSLVHGHTRSCGCLYREDLRTRRKTHGRSKIKDPTYDSWRAMLERCRNPNNRAYARYGGRGVKVCERWLDFACFFQDMGQRPDGLTLERKNSDKDYEPSNCEWATRQRQSVNRSTTRNLTVKGQTKSITEWARDVGIGRDTIRDRLAKGWSHEDAVLKPPRSLRR
jgi:hypothetical protein